MIKSVLVAGGGSAGLLTALALKQKIPQLQIRVVRSKDIGVIGVGESTTPQITHLLFDYLKLPQTLFYSTVRPTWKTGIHFLWGPRKSFDYAFQFQLDAFYSDLNRYNGFYCGDDFDSVNMNAALMAQGKAFETHPSGQGPLITDVAALHLFNPALVAALETASVARGIEIIDARITGVPVDEQGVQSIIVDDGRTFSADLYVDASGFRSELLGRALGTPFVPYDRSLYCDRAIVGSWDRTDEFIYPYTIAETMEAGWCWQIDHEHAINRGYVYSSRFLSDDQARDEFLKKNPRAKTWDHVVKFRSGRYEKGWVKNVFAIGNACGFVEPLEATALMVASSQIKSMVEMLVQSQLDPTPGIQALYNTLFVDWWDGIKDFLSIHYRFNTRIKNEFWTTCCNEVDVTPVQPLLDFYRENGPTGFCRHYLTSTIGLDNQFGLEGFLVMLVGQKVPYRDAHPPSQAELAIFHRHCAENRARAMRGLTVAEALQYVQRPDWRWNSDPQ
jgi:tryptophan 7-halogenase